MSWRVAHFGEPDADGLVNLLEYALAANPFVGDSSALPAIARQDGHLVLSFRRVADPALHYSVEATAELWPTPGPKRSGTAPERPTSPAP